MWYYGSMSRDDKLLRKMRQSPRNIRFSELDGFLRRQGFKRRQPRKGGSHYFYSREDGVRFTIVMPHGDQKTVDPAAIDEVLEQLDL
jgi:predicted RNA binding protein YcfA (HicA-like mRNA interferase family)